MALSRELMTKIELSKCEEFYKFLTDNKILANYIHAVVDQHTLCTDNEFSNVVKSIPQYYEQRPYLLFNHGLFIFRKTKEKRLFWTNIQKQWFNYLYRPLTSQELKTFQSDVSQ